MSDKVLVPVELLQKIVDALRIANDWNLDELNIEPPEEWGLELPEDCNGVMEGWCYTTDFANHIESLIEAAPEPASVRIEPQCVNSATAGLWSKPVSAEPVAWMHILHMELGQTHEKITDSKHDPFGDKGIDYDPDFFVESLPLYASQPAQEWVKCSERMPDHSEPVIYLRAKDGKFSVGIAYWTVSQKWKPEAQSMKCPEGFTHWMPLPQPPQE